MHFSALPAPLLAKRLSIDFGTISGVQRFPF
jgi:hypothetical protein